MNAFTWHTLANIPDTYPVKAMIGADAIAAATDPVTDGTCGLTWDDAIVTGMTPAPSGRCPFEAFHADSAQRNFTALATSTVFMGDYLPAHDDVFDLAEDIAGKLTALHAYITKVRDADQADDAVRELLKAFSDETEWSN